MPSTRPPAESAPASSVLERILAIAAATCVGLALLGFVLTLLQIALRDALPWLRDGVWPQMFAVPAILLPVGLVCVIALLVVSAMRKGRGRG